MPRRTQVALRLSQALLEEGSWPKKLERFLLVLLGIPWLPLKPTGAIFLKRGESLHLVAERNLDGPLKSLCARVPLGRCLCGRVGLTGVALHAAEVDEEHETRYEGMPPHGHALYPLKVGERVLGVLNLYLEPGARLSSEARATLEMAAGLLALAVLRERAERAARVLHRATLLSLEAADEAAYLKGLCALLVEEGYALAWVGEALADGRVRPVEGAGAVAYLEGLVVRWDEAPEGQGPTGRAVRLGMPQVLRDRDQDPRYGPWRARARAFGLASSAALPIRLGERVWGALNVYAPEADAFDAEEVELLQDLARLAGKSLERFRAEARAHLLAQVVEEVPEGIFVTDLEGRILYANRALFAHTGYAPEEVLGQTPRLFKSGKHPAAFYQALWETLDRGQVFQAVFWNRRKDGQLLVEHKLLTPLRDPRGQVVAYASTGREITREYSLYRVQQVLLRHLDLFLRQGAGRGHLQGFLREALEAVPGADGAGLLLQGKDGLYSFAALVGMEPSLGELVLTEEEFQGLGLAAWGRLGGEEVGRLLQALPEEKRRLFQAGFLRLREAVYARLEVAGKAVGLLFFASFAAPLPQSVGETVQLLALELRGLLEWEREQTRAHYLTYHDPLTGLPNRARLEAEHPQLDGPVALALLDLDGFGQVQEALGRSGGDALLRALAQRLEGLLPPGARLYRTGEDEFLFLLPLDLPGVEAFHRRLQEALAHPVPVLGQPVRVRASLGVVFAPRDGRALPALLRRADLALRRAKAQGRGGLAFFDLEVEEAYRRRTELLSGLERALGEGSLALFAQPIAELDTGKPVALELLLRWSREGGFVPAAEFIPLAEEAGLIPELDLYVLRQVGALPDTGACYHVNLSPKTLLDPRLLEVARGLQGRRLRMELTEYALAQPGSEEVLLALKRMGFGLALDDFGQGYASLKTLASHPFSVVKVDRAFTRGIGREPRAEAVLRSVVGLAQELGLLLVAEGVEREEERAWLLRAGYRLGQGYLLGRPAPFWPSGV
ncbi:bifunctional diguanylate cyclase/phosphodiesterase [Thermus sp. FJN-A]